MYMMAPCIHTTSWYIASYWIFIRVYINLWFYLYLACKQIQFIIRHLLHLFNNLYPQFKLFFGRFFFHFCVVFLQFITFRMFSVRNVSHMFAVQFTQLVLFCIGLDCCPSLSNYFFLSRFLLIYAQKSILKISKTVFHSSVIHWDHKLIEFCSIFVTDFGGFKIE